MTGQGSTIRDMTEKKTTAKKTSPKKATKSEDTAKTGDSETKVTQGKPEGGTITPPTPGVSRHAHSPYAQ